MNHNEIPNGDFSNISPQECAAIKYAKLNSRKILDNSTLLAKIIAGVLQEQTYKELAEANHKDLECVTGCSDLDKLRAAVGYAARSTIQPQILQPITSKKLGDNIRGAGQTEVAFQKRLKSTGEHEWTGEQNAELFFILQDADVYVNKPNKKNAVPNFDIVRDRLQSAFPQIPMPCTQIIQGHWYQMRRKVYEVQGEKRPKEYIDWEADGHNERLLILVRDTRFHHINGAHAGSPNYALIAKEMGKPFTTKMCRYQMINLRRNIVPELRVREGTIRWERDGYNAKLLALVSDATFHYVHGPHLGKPNFQRIAEAMGEGFTSKMCSSQMQSLRRRKKA